MSLPHFKMWCCNCSMPLSVKDPLRPRGLRSPLLLHCGHTSCEHCIKTSLSKNSHVQCGICGDKTIHQPGADFKEDFPCNIFMLGVFASRSMNQEHEDRKIAFIPAGASTSNTGKKHYVGSLEPKKPVTSGKVKKKVCCECTGTAVDWHCQQCSEDYCTPCFKTVHCAAKALMKHTKLKVVDQLQPLIKEPTCTEHNQKYDFFCDDCNKICCAHCVIISHQGHVCITMKTKNEKSLPLLNEAYDKAIEVLKRLLHTQKKTKAIPTSDSNAGTEKLNQVEQQISQHFQFLHGYLQCMESQLLQQVTEMKQQKQKNLKEISSRLEEDIQFVQQILQEAAALRMAENLGKGNLEEVTRLLLSVQNIPCHLLNQNCDPCEEDVKFTVDKSFIEGLENHCLLDAPSNAEYTLVKTEDLPPGTPVEPAADISLDIGFAVNGNGASHSGSSFSTFKEQGCIAASPAPSDNSSVSSKDTLTAQGYTIKGSTEVVKVCYITSPSSFYVHRLSDLGTLKQFSNQLSKQVNIHSGVPQCVTKDGLYLAHFHTDGKWYRARVQEVLPPSETDEELVKICYVDYGNSEIVPTSRLRQIPGKFSITPNLALHCALFGVSPAHGNWSEESTRTFADMVQDHRMLMVVMDVVANVLQVDLCQLPSDKVDSAVPVSVRDAFVFLDMGHFLDNSSAIDMKSDQHYDYFQPQGIQPGEHLNVVVSHVVSPTNLYVQQVGDNTNRLHSLMMKINENYVNCGKKGLIYSPRVGMPCAAQFSADDRWYRAKIIGIPKKKSVEVFYVDYGNTEVLSWTRIRHISGSFLQIAAQGIHCALSDIAPPKSYVGRWPVEASEFLTKNTGKKVLRMHVDSYTPSLFKVSLYETQPVVDICINALLVRSGFAISVGSSSELVEYPKSNGGMPVVPKNLFVTDKAQEAKKTILKKENARVLSSDTGSSSSEAGGAPSNRGKAFNKRGNAPSKRGKARSTEREPGKNKQQQELDKSVDVDLVNERDPIHLEVKVLAVSSPSCFYISLISQESQISTMMSELQVYYSKATSHCTKWTVNSKCAAFSPKDMQWYRGIIVEMLPEEKAKVFLKDFAMLEEIPLVNLQLLDDQFLKVRDGAVRCHLAGVQAAGGKSEWPMLACEVLSDMINESDKLYITKKGEIQNFSLPVELSVKHMIAGGPLDPITEEWITLNSKLVEKGVALPLRDDSANVPSHQVLQELGEQQNLGTLSDMMQVKCQRVESSASEACEREEVYEEEVEMSDSEDSVEVVSSTTDWLPAVPLTKTNFIATPTFVDFDCCIYLHDTKQSGDTLRVIQNALQSKFGSTTPKPHDLYWFPGQICIVQYHHDKNWYRGKVLEVKDDLSLKVMFVDYGNVEDCKASELRKSIYMREIPIQCHRCQLDGITPVFEDGKWPVSVLDFVHTSIVDKQCLVEVKEPYTEGEPLKITLRPPGNLDIASVLVSMHYATYTVIPDSFSAMPEKDRDEDEDDSVIVEGSVDEGSSDEILEDGMCQPEEVGESKDLRESTTQGVNNSVPPDENIDGHKVHVFEASPEPSTDQAKSECLIIQSGEEKGVPLELLEVNQLQEAGVMEGQVEDKNKFINSDQNNSSESEADSYETSDGELVQGLSQTIVIVEPARCYRTLDLPDIDLLSAEVTAMFSATEVALHLCKIETPELQQMKKDFDKLGEILQEQGPLQPLLDIFEIDQPCCACFTDDGLWYRAIVREVDQETRLAKVQYVDYGNSECLEFARLRKVKSEWLHVPKQAVHCKLWHIEVTDKWDTSVALPKFVECMFQRPLLARIKAKKTEVEAEIFLEDRVSLAYQPLLDEEFLELIKED